MINKIDSINNIKDFDNILITDENGVVLFYDTSDFNLLKELGIDPNKIIGSKVTDLYTNISDETSSIMKVLRTGVPILNRKEDLVTKDGNIIQEISSNYPIIENNKIIGNIEFSKFFYSKGNSQMMANHTRHKIFRKNNTIYTIDDIITVNPLLQRIKDKLPQIAKNNSSVLIYGETGTGKEIVAQSIHNLSDRFNNPFISLNCAGIPSTLIESILFGTTKGSFTGSIDSEGLFESANGGTIFLDEINSLDISLQAKLLKVIEEKRMRRLGSTKSIPLDIRIISAVNEEPYLIIEKKILRADLFYRLGVVQLSLPNLSERKEDIMELLKFYINHFNSNMNVHVKDVHPDVIDCFQRYNWPGNVRELKNAVEMAFNKINSTQITINDIPDRIRNYYTSSNPDSTHVFSDNSNSTDLKSLKHEFEEQEKKIIQKVLQDTNLKVSEASRKLCISKELLKYKIEKYNL